MGALFGDEPLVEHDDAVGVAHRRQPVGDDHRGATPQRMFERFLHMRFVLVVEVAGGLVENHHRGVLQEQTGNGQPLLLATAHAVTALAHHGVVAIGQRIDHLEDTSATAGLVEFGIGGIGLGVAQVGAHRVVEQMRVLAHHADGSTQRFLGEVAHIAPIDTHRAIAHVVEAGKQ